jgi:glycine/D-amino acid oxidase-like deaminating enzyme
MRVIICGGGVIGTSIAYFLSLRGVEAMVVESTDVACGASGKSGGFLALDWCEGSPLAPLARCSFELHSELDETLDADWGYRRMETFGVIASARRDTLSFRRLPSSDWLGADTAIHSRIGTLQTTAQVDPAAFTRAMMAAAGANGASLHMGRVTGMTYAPDLQSVRGVLVDNTEIEADAVVIAMGPWSILATQWLPLPGVYGLKGHSFIFRCDTPIPPEALFVEYETHDGTVHSPEIVPRPDGTIYVCGVSSRTAMPVDPSVVSGDAGAHETLLAMTAHVSPLLGASEVLRMQACFRPVTDDNLPFIGRVAGLNRAYVATGHSVWGMLNAPATGKAMAELIVDGAAQTVDLTAFDPARLRPLSRTGPWQPVT